VSATAPITDANPSVADMEARVARFAALQPTDDYLDSAIPGCERTPPFDHVRGNMRP
jgi:hypothetical protein